MSEQTDDTSVNHPPHYTVNGIEVLDVIEAYGLNFRLGNTVKYVLRAGKKDSSTYVQDLKKARFYLDREIAQATKEEYKGYFKEMIDWPMEMPGTSVPVPPWMSRVVLAKEDNVSSK